MPRLSEIGGKRLPFLRWSFLRVGLSMRRLTTEWQVGDGREQALLEHLLANAKPGDLDAAIATVDDFCYRQKFMINVGDEKGAILDAAIRRARPELALELGTYCGYSALRTVRALGPSGRLVSIEFNADNARIAGEILRHAGVAGRVSIVVGTLGDGGTTADALEREHGFGSGSLDFAFLDHTKEAYLPDLELIVARGWLRPGAIVVADNVKFPGAPDYLAHMRAAEGRDWRTQEHSTHAEYQTLIKDLVLESEYLGAVA
jgi:catechol O-methyltransferase